MTVVDLLEQALGKKAVKILEPIQPGDVVETFADIEELARDVNFRPQTRIEDGVSRFARWFEQYHGR